MWNRIEIIKKGASFRPGQGYTGLLEKMRIGLHDAGKDGSRKRMYKKCYDVEKLKKYVNEGKSNVEIAYLLDISVATVIAGVKAYGLKGIRKRGRPKKEMIH